MDNCSFSLNIGNINKVFKTREELEEFVNSNYEEVVKNLPLLNTKFSISGATASQQATIDKLLAIKSQVDQSGFGLKVNGKQLAGVSRVIGSYEFEGNRITPEFIIENYVSDRLGKAKTQFIKDLRFSDKYVKDEDERRNNVAKTDDEIIADYKAEYDEVMKNEEFDISNDMDLWNIKAGSGTVWHFVGETFFNNINNGKETTVDEIRQALSDFVESSKDSKVKHIVLSDDVAQQLLDYLNDKLQEMRGIAGDNLTFLTEIPIYTEEKIKIKDKGVTKNYEGIGGIVDLLAVNDKGQVFMFDYKTSSKNYANWDSAKTAAVHIQQIMYGKMLEKHGVNFAGKYIIPIKYEGFEEFDRAGVTYYNVKSFTGESSILISDGMINERQNRAINEMIKPNSSISTAISASNSNTIELLNTMFDYSPSSSENVADVDKIADIVIRNSKEPGKYRYYSKLGDKTIYINEPDPLKAKDTIKARISEVVKKEGEIMKSLPRYIKFYFSKFQEASRKGEQPEFSFSKDEWTNNQIDQMLRQYVMDDNWKIIDNNEAEKIGLIMFVNTKTNVINILNISNRDIMKPLKLDKGTTLLGKFMSNSRAKSKGLTDATISDLEMIKAYSFIMSNKDVFDGYSIGAMETWEIDFQHRVKNRTYQFVSKVKKDYEIIRNSGFADRASMPLWNASIADLGDVAVDLVSESLDEFHNKAGRYTVDKMLELAGSYNTMDIQSKINILSALHNKILGMYGTIEDVTNDKMRRILNMLAQSIATLSGIQLAVQPDYDTGLMAANSLDWTNPTYMNHPFIEGVRKMIAQGLDNTAVRFNDITKGKDAAFRAFYNEDSASALSVKVSGDPVPHFRGILEKVNGKYTGRLINPNTPGLSKAQSKFIKAYADMIYDIRVESLMEQGRSMEVAERTAESYYYDVPIMKASVMSAFKSKGLGEAMKAYKDYILNPNRFYDQSQADVAKSSSNTFVASTFDYTEPWNADARKKVLDAQEDAPLEEDLELMYYMFAMNSAKAIEMSKVTPIINIIRTLLYTSKDFQYEDLTNIAKFTDEFVNYAVHNKRKIEKSEEKMAPFLYAVKDLNSMIVLGFNPFQLITEGFAGFYNNISRTIANLAGNKTHSFKSLSKAYAVVMYENMTPERIKFIDQISRTMRIVERSPFELTEKEQVGRRGLVNAKSHWGYFFSSYPNYVNRLALAMSKMIEDGVIIYEGVNISRKSPLNIVNGKLTYNPKLDKRFSVYLNNKNQDELTASKQWKEQKALYDAMMLDMQGVYGGIVNGELGFPYTPKERESIRNNNDRLHGHISPETKAAIERDSMASLFLQFKAWAFPKIRRWYISKGLRQSEGNYVVTTNEDGTVTAGFEAYYMEGILQTLGSIAKDIYKTKSLIKAYKEITPHQKENLVLAMSDILIFGLVAMIINALTDMDDKKRPALEARLSRAFLQSAGDLNVLNTVNMFINPDGAFIPIAGTASNLFTSTIDLVAFKEGAGNQFMSNFGVYRSARDLANVSTK